MVRAALAFRLHERFVGEKRKIEDNIKKFVPDGLTEDFRAIERMINKLSKAKTDYVKASIANSFTAAMTIADAKLPADLIGKVNKLWCRDNLVRVRKDTQAWANVPIAHSDGTKTEPHYFNMNIMQDFLGNEIYIGQAMNVNGTGWDYWHLAWQKQVNFRLFSQSVLF